MKEESLFDALLTIPTPAEKEAFLQAKCGADVRLRNRLAKLLAGDSRQNGILDAFVVNKSPETIRQIGSYYLKELLGEGGFGQVFAAEQHEPVRREVAIKLIKPGMDSREVIARFSAERQTLSLMDHANIARVLDAGSTENDRPYFVMELVRGKNITEYCDAERLTTHQRLNLFLPICQAVQHAHQKGIIHRDLKPSNILVTERDGRPMVKVIDFGVAKALDPHQSYASPQTRDTQLIGTPAYMSPEQAEIGRRDIDTRTDIYSLGVLLYELLAGATPFDGDRWKSASFDEIRRIIREEEPPKPSARFSTLGAAATTISANRRSHPRELSKLFRGELDWIVMKAIDKDRDRRYATVTELAKDIQRYLADEPVEASPPSTLYRVRKFARRHRYAVLTAFGMIVLLAGGIVGTTLGMFRARQAEAAEKLRAKAEERERIRAVMAETQSKAKTKEALEAAEIANNLVAFLCDDVLGVADVYTQVDRGISTRPNITVRHALDQAAAKLDGQFNVQPRVEANIRYALGVAYFQLDQDQQAIDQLQNATKIFATRLGAADPQTLEAEIALARAYCQLGRAREAIEIHEKVRDVQIASLGADDLRTLLNLGYLAESYSFHHRHAEALALHQQVYETYLRKLGPTHKLTLTSLELLAQSQANVDNLDEAAVIFEQLKEDMPKAFGEEHPRTLNAMENLGVVYWRQRKLERSIDIFEYLLPKVQKVWGTNAFKTYRLMVNLGVNCRAHGQSEKAIALLSGVFKAGVTDCNLRTWAGIELTRAYLAAHDREKAAQAMITLIKAIRDNNAPLSRGLAAELLECTQVVHELEDWRLAESLLRESLAIWELPPMDVSNVLITEAFLGETLLQHATNIPEGPQTESLLADAEKLLLKSGVGLTELKTPDLYTKQVRRKTIETLILHFEATGNQEQLSRWRQEKELHSKPKK
jgi:eukaryotic-like serine/threonine-protein kinase